MDEAAISDEWPSDAVFLSSGRESGPKLLRDCAAFMDRYGFEEVEWITFSVEGTARDCSIGLWFVDDVVEPFDFVEPAVEWPRPDLLRYVGSGRLSQAGLREIAQALDAEHATSIVAIRLSQIFEDELFEVLVFVGDY